MEPRIDSQNADAITPPPADVTKVVDVIAGENTDPVRRNWIEANITSIREKVKDGSYSTLLYPASGADILRPLVAYDVDHLIAVDVNPHNEGETERRLALLGIQPQVVISADGKRKDLSFSIDGKPRVVTEISEDARRVTLESLGMESVDVLHVYLPTGATQPITEDEVYFQEKYGDEWYSKQYEYDAVEKMRNDPDAPKPNKEGNYKTVVEGISKELTPRNYQQVAVGGFFVFGENSLQRENPLPVLYEIIGVAEKQITERHPFTITTSFFPDESELAERDRVGYIYQKVRTVTPEIIEIFDEAQSNLAQGFYHFMEFERGDFQYSGIQSEKGIHVQEGIQTKYGEFQKEVDAIADRFRKAGVDETLVGRYKAEALGSYKERILTLQIKLQELVNAYQEVSQEYQGGKISGEEALTKLGVVLKQDRYGKTDIKNTKWPLAGQLAIPGGNSDTTHEVIRQFAQASFDF